MLIPSTTDLEAQNDATVHKLCYDEPAYTISFITGVNDTYLMIHAAVMYAKACLLNNLHL